MSKIELAWAAGFYDGEGCTRCDFVNKKQGYNNACLSMSVKQVQIEPLKRFCKAANGGKVFGPYKGAKKNWSPIHIWRAHGKEAAKVYARLKPYLSKPKTDQAEAALKTAGMLRKIKKVRY